MRQYQRIRTMWAFPYTEMDLYIYKLREYHRHNGNRVKCFSVLYAKKGYFNYFNNIINPCCHSQEIVHKLSLQTLLALQIKFHTCANSVDPDETVRNEPSHQELHCLPFCV